MCMAQAQAETINPPPVPPAIVKPQQFYHDGAVREVIKREGSLDAIQKYIVQHEGFVGGDYDDTKGVSTSGVGQTGIYKDKTFKETYEIHKQKAKELVPDYDGLPLNGQKAIMSLIYRGDIKKDHEWLASLNKGEYKKAAKELLNHKEYKDLVKRKKETGKDSGIIKRLEEASEYIKNI